MKKIILIATLLVFVGCSSDEKQETSTQKIKKTEVEKKVTHKEVKQEAKIVKEITNTVVATARSGEDIFKACSACHGASGEKAALGKSKIIKAWDASKISTALNGYKDGTYGGAMKALMKGQATSLSDEDIKKVSEYISKL